MLREIPNVQFFSLIGTARNGIAVQYIDDAVAVKVFVWIGLTILILT